APLAQVPEVELEVGLVQVNRGPVAWIPRREQQHQMDHRTTGESPARGVVVPANQPIGAALLEPDPIAPDAGVLARHCRDTSFGVAGGGQLEQRLAVTAVDLEQLDV